MEETGDCRKIAVAVAHRNADPVIRVDQVLGFRIEVENAEDRRLEINLPAGLSAGAATQQPE